MAFGRRVPDDRRAEHRREVLKHAVLHSHKDGTQVTGLVRNISRDGAKFITKLPVTLSGHVTLEFSNGETFDCEVVRDVGGKTFGLRFTNASVFDISQTRECVDGLHELVTDRSPRKIYELLEDVGFFGDEELVSRMTDLIDSYDRAVKICNERVLTS